MEIVVVVVVLVLAAVAVAYGLSRRADRSSASEHRSAPTEPPVTSRAPTQEHARPASPVASTPSVAPRIHPSPELVERGRPPFAIIDVETTGLHPVPDGTNRIVEIAVVRMSSDGRIEDEYVTLVNPQRKMGATRIHGITAADVASAPAFAEVAGDVASRLAGAIVVAHNAPFDLRFLRGEYENMRLAMPNVPTLCTLDLAYQFADVSCRKLGFLCEEYGIAIDQHTALGDARAVGQLLMRFLGDARAAGRDIGFPEIPVVGSEWCSARPSGLSVPRGTRDETATANTVFAKRSVRRSTKLSEERYFEALELALADGVLTSDESAALCSFALSLDVPVRDLNRKFVQSLADGAKADGTVTPAEAEEVYRAARLLDIADADAAAMLAIESAQGRQNDPRLMEGTAVCIVGWFEGPTMAHVFEAATQANLIIRKNITQSVGAVLVERRGHNTVRENRAKALGIPVITAEDFMRLLEPTRAKA